MAEDSFTRGVSNPNNSPRYGSGQKDVARKEQMSYKRSNSGGQTKRNDRQQKRS
jgi:hypothetical protein